MYVNNGGGGNTAIIVGIIVVVVVAIIGYFMYKSAKDEEDRVACETETWKTWNTDTGVCDTDQAMKDEHDCGVRTEPWMGWNSTTKECEVIDQDAKDQHDCENKTEAWYAWDDENKECTENTVIKECVEVGKRWDTETGACMLNTDATTHLDRLGETYTEEQEAQSESESDWRNKTHTTSTATTEAEAEQNYDSAQTQGGFGGGATRQSETHAAEVIQGDLDSWKTYAENAKTTLDGYIFTVENIPDFDSDTSYAYIGYTSLLTKADNLITAATDADYDRAKELYDTFKGEMETATEADKTLKEIYQLCKADGTWGIIDEDTSDTLAAGGTVGSSFITGGCRTVQLKTDNSGKVVKGYKIQQEDGTFPTTFVDKWFSEDSDNEMCQIDDGNLYEITGDDYSKYAKLTSKCEVNHIRSGKDNYNYINDPP